LNSMAHCISASYTTPKREAALQILDQTALNVTTKQPAIPKENILLIEAVHDLLAPPAPIEELWRQWRQPDIWRLPHGHFSFSLIGAPGLMAARVLGWLAPRLREPTATVLGSAASSHELPGAGT